MLINILLFVSSDVLLTPEQQSVKTTVQNGPRFRTVQTLAAHTRGSVCRASGSVQVGFEEARSGFREAVSEELPVGRLIGSRGSRFAATAE
jgi:hypothetical protein